MEKFKFITKDKISKLPKNPGVYTFKKGRDFLYIGKAVNIQNRVKNHFQQPKSIWEQTLLRQACLPARQGFGGRVGFIKTNSEIEALLLEADIIKKYQPKYNVIWRDDKNYFFAGITKEDFPQIFITHQAKKDSKTKGKKIKAAYVGPFVDGKALKQALKTLRKVFPYRSCKTLPKKPCLWYQLERCPAPCLTKSKVVKQIPTSFLKMKKECQQNAKNLVEILQGKKKQVLKNLKKEMKKSSIIQDFEKAAKVRDRIISLEKVFSHAKIFEETKLIPAKEWLKIQKIFRSLLKTSGKISRIEAYDISNIQGKEATGSMVVFIEGYPNKKFYRKFKIKFIKKPNDIAMIKEILVRRLKHEEWSLPDLILIDGGKAQLNAVQSIINKKGMAIPIVALAKKKSELYIKNRRTPILLKKLPREIFNLLLQLRDEAHRFAITYHRNLRKIDLIPKF